MPIIINDQGQLNTVSATGKQTALTTNLSVNNSPKFFDKILTGNGADNSRGLLCSARNPKNYPSGYSKILNQNMTRRHYTNGDVTIYDIPLDPISMTLYGHINTYTRPDLGMMTKIAHNDRFGVDVYLDMKLHSVSIEITEKTTTNILTGQSTRQVISRDLSADFNMFIYFVKDVTNPDHKNMHTLHHMLLTKNLNENTYFNDIVTNIFSTLRNIESVLVNGGFTTDRDAMNHMFNDYSLYDELCRSAVDWQTNIADIVGTKLTQALYDESVKTQNNNLLIDKHYSLVQVAQNMEWYNVPLEQYIQTYNNMAKILPADILEKVCKPNINLVLTNTLETLDKKRTTAPFVPCNNHIKAPLPLSKEQIAAIETQEPYAMAQAVAGSGKSTVILYRMQHMLANSIKGEDVLVLSFTNAAADHILEICPTVRSMTIASMMHAIYSTNYPDHMLSSISTILNAIDISYPATANVSRAKSKFLSNFKYTLERLRDNNEWSRAINFVEENLIEVIDTLCTIGQTSLELESIICYLKMDTLVEPKEVQAKHIIVDEVQDNSISEFIYLMKYAARHDCSMFIVGDCSQTLYEFRSANPKALNVLESSNVFKPYKLQTNYRSTQDILDFANSVLDNIEANRFANLQLKANSLAPVSLQSFQTAVNMHYERIPNKAAVNIANVMDMSIGYHMRRWIDTKLQNGEQIAILAPTRATLSAVCERIMKTYPTAKIASLIPKRQRDTSIFSKFIARYWNTVVYAPPQNILSTLNQAIVAKSAMLAANSSQQSRQKTSQIINSMMTDFCAKYSGIITNWEMQVRASMMPMATMMDELKKLMIRFEIERNAVAQAINSAKNAAAKTNNDVATANFIISTIHSAKGLEFDNVIVYYPAEADSQTDEADKRMYYVALTRAKKSEFIYGYGVIARPKLQTEYERIVLDLQNKQAQANDTASGNPNDPNDPNNTPNVVQSASNTPMAIPTQPVAINPYGAPAIQLNSAPSDGKDEVVADLFGPIYSKDDEVGEDENDAIAQLTANFISNSTNDTVNPNSTDTSGSVPADDTDEDI